MTASRAAALPLVLALAGCTSTTTTPVDSTHPNASGASGECLASMTQARPEGWVDAGELVVGVSGGKPTTIEVHDASGKVLGKHPADATSPEASRESLRQAVCEAGGFLGVLLGKPPSSGTTKISVLRPAKEDEAADLTLMCNEPKDMPADFDLSQRVVVARHMYEEVLTSKRYRSWLHGMDNAVKSDDQAEKARRIDDLSAQAKAAGKQTCWFADNLRKALAGDAH
jgi:hypothetical protein